MQLILKNIFTDFPKLKIIIPHGGGCVPYHWGRYRGLAQDNNRPLLDEMLNNIWFDTCVYHQPGVEMLLRTVPIDNLMFASEVWGAVRGIDPESGHYYDDTKRHVDAATWLTKEDQAKVFELNARKVFPKLDAHIQRLGLTA
jgi:4-oxalmesaconate hydratase